MVHADPTWLEIATASPTATFYVANGQNPKLEAPPGPLPIFVSAPVDDPETNCAARVKKLCARPRPGAQSPPPSRRRPIARGEGGQPVRAGSHGTKLNNCDTPLIRFLFAREPSRSRFVHTYRTWGLTKRIFLPEICQEENTNAASCSSRHESC